MLPPFAKAVERLAEGDCVKAEVVSDATFRTNPSLSLRRVRFSKNLAAEAKAAKLGRSAGSGVQTYPKLWLASYQLVLSVIST